jgi:hypothetical protein
MGRIRGCNMAVVYAKIKAISGRVVGWMDTTAMPYNVISMQGGELHSKMEVSSNQPSAASGINTASLGDLPSLIIRDHVATHRFLDDT